MFGTDHLNRSLTNRAAVRNEEIYGIFRISRIDSGISQLIPSVWYHEWSSISTRYELNPINWHAWLVFIRLHWKRSFQNTMWAVRYTREKVVANSSFLIHRRIFCLNIDYSCDECAIERTRAHLKMHSTFSWRQCTQQTNGQPDQNKITTSKATSLIE